MNTLFPVYIYEEGLELPTEGTYYLVSGNGLWLHKDTGIISAFVPVKNISVLEELDIEAQVDMNMPKLPAKQVYKIKKFFQEVVSLYHAESATILYYNKKTNEFKVQVTDQSVSHGGVNYKRIALSHTEDMADFLRVGTIHSHCDFGAFHSGTDIGDEEDFDGLHCTFGHNNKDEFTITASIVVNGYRLEVDPMTVLEGVQPVKITKPIEPVKTNSLYKKFSKREDLFFLEDPSEETLNEWESEKDQWLSHVKNSTRSTFSWLFKDQVDENVDLETKSTFSGLFKDEPEYFKDEPEWYKDEPEWYKDEPEWYKDELELDENIEPVNEITKGSKVIWSGDLNQVKMKESVGDGPFEVIDRIGDRLIINTKIGKASLSVKLFKKDDES